MFSSLKARLGIKPKTTKPVEVTASQVGIDKNGLDVVSYPADGIQDAFARLRTSNITTIFDSKQLYDSQPLFWDDQETSGSGTSSSHSVDKAATTIGVSASTAGTRVRQTFQRFNYQPGKSQLIVMTGVISSGGTQSGITGRIGYFDENNGLFFEIKDGVIYTVRRTKAHGYVYEERVAQSDWNLDKLDGSGPSGVTLNPNYTQILFLDFEWLGVGRVRMGFFNNGAPIYCHEFRNVNRRDRVYMSTPNLPLRYEISNDGTGPAAHLDHICSSVASEGGADNNGILRHADSGAVSSLSSGTTYAILGIRLKSTHLSMSILLETLSYIATSVNDQSHWELIFNPTVAGTFTYSDAADSGVQIATGSNSNTVTGGYELDGGYFATSLPVTNAVPNALKLGAAIDGTVDEIVLAARPITNNITVEGSLTWRELS